jgi:homoserine/homoserine lactone efflux protein
MMEVFNHLFAFLSVTLLLSASPGPVMINCMTDAAHYGLKKTFLSMLGISLGNLMLILLSALGVALFLEQFPEALIWIQYIGGAYLIYLGVQLFRRPAGDLKADTKYQNSHLFLKGFLIAVTNPKGIIYFGALFPQFIDQSQGLPVQYAYLTMIFLCIDLCWMFIYAIAGKKIMHGIQSPKHQKTFNRICGGLLIIAGIVLGFYH